MICQFELRGGMWICPKCGQSHKNRTGSPASAICKTKGPGDFLHSAILFWTKEAPTRGCGCEDLIAKMNTWGSSCRDHIDEIVSHMLAEAKTRGWKLAAMPGAATVARLMVLRSIRQSEREANRAAIASQSRD